MKEIEVPEYFKNASPEEIRKILKILKKAIQITEREIEKEKSQGDFSNEKMLGFEIRLKEYNNQLAKWSKVGE